jgi:hypothetical protein
MQAKRPLRITNPVTSGNDNSSQQKVTRVYSQALESIDIDQDIADRQGLRCFAVPVGILCID